MKKMNNKMCSSYVLVLNWAQCLLKMLMHFFLKSEFGIFLMAIAILINSKKMDAMLFDLDSMDSMAFLMGASIARSYFMFCQNWWFWKWFFIMGEFQKISG